MLPQPRSCASGRRRCTAAAAAAAAAATAQAIRQPAPTCIGFVPPRLDGSTVEWPVCARSNGLTMGEDHVIVARRLKSLP